MASGLRRKRAAGYLAALLPLWGFCLARLWALLSGHAPGKLTTALALLLAAGLAGSFWRFDLDGRLLRPFSSRLNLLVAAGAGLLGAGLDTSYWMLDPTGTPLAHPLMRVLCAVGSGLVFAGGVLILCSATRAWGRVEMGSPWQLLALFVAVNALAIFYLSTSATVYVWDNAGYWTVARTLAEAPLGLGQLRQVAGSIVTQEYNYLLAYPISLVMRLFGGSRAVFVLSIVDLYLLPALLGLCALGREQKWGGAVLALLFPGLTYLALVGFVDVAACAVAIWAVVFYTKGNAPSWARGILTGTCLALSFLLRRYFLFFAAAFALAALARLLANRTREEGRAFGCLCAAGATWAVYCTQAFLVDKLTTDYGALYAAYALGLRSDAMLFCRYFGYLVLAAALLWGLYRAVLRREARGDMLLALVQLAACFFLLTRVQSHGQQHILLYLPCLALLLAPQREDPPWKGRTAWALGAVCTLVALLPRPQPSSISAIKVPDPVPGFSFYGPRREDIDQLLSLDYYLTVNHPNSSVAVCASSLLLNSETLTNLRPSLGKQPPDPGHGVSYIYVNSVDKRDPFTWAMLDADYLVVGDPVQVHLGEENQQLIALVAHAVLDGTGLGTAYQRLPVSYTLQDGSMIYVYQRTRPVTDEEQAWVSEQLSEKYPEYRSLYQVP